MTLEAMAAASMSRVTRLMRRVTPLRYFVLHDDASTTTAPADFSSLESGLASSLPALLFALQLPRHRQDAHDASNKEILESRHLEQRARIHLMPVSRFRAETIGRFQQAERTAVIAPDAALPRIRPISTALRFTVPPIGFSRLSTTELRRTWHLIAVRSADGAETLRANQTLSRFDMAPTAVPLGFLRYQFAKQKGRFPASGATRIEDLLHIWTLVTVMSEFEDAGYDPATAEAHWKAAYARQRQMTRIPVAIGAPGVSPTQEGVVARALDVDPVELRGLDARLEAENNALSALTAGVASSSSGAGITIDSVPRQAFHALADLERHWASGAKPAKVRRLLQKLNDAAKPMWTDDLRLAVARAETLTVFSNFPVGLLSFPGDSAPLSYRIPVVQRPISSLTRALNYEFAALPQADFSHGFKVVVVECVDPSDPIAVHSRAGWDVAEDLLKTSGHKNLKFVRVDASTPTDIHDAIATETPDILVLSAHGSVENGVAGIRVGNEFFAADTPASWPSVVILSACRVAPRGSGGPNIADRILEQGALAVIAPQVDVNVQHNALLCVRLFVYMVEAVSGTEPERNLRDVWHRVLSSSAIADMMNTSKPLGRWLGTQRASGRTQFTHFMIEATSGKIRRTHAFEDSERFVTQIAQGERDGESVRGWLASPGYLPESVFYSISGKPERVLFKRRSVLSLSEVSDD
jgi:hypothetical protein